MPDRSFLQRIAMPVLLAAAMTGLNALKPPCIDDTAYLAVARQLAAHPLDPYGFEAFWYDVPQPANGVLAPPVLPYWLGLGIRLLGERPVVLKLWLFPIALLLTISVRSLLHRFARGAESPLLAAIILSPSILPAFNFMLDIPALALGTTALAVGLRALDRGSWSGAAVSGLIAGLAAQTKYTGAIAAAALLGFALLRRRPLAGIAAAGSAAAVFVSWELFVRGLYGESHFMRALGESEGGLIAQMWTLSAAPALLGAVGPPLVFVALVALKRARWVAPAAGLAMVGYIAIALVPDTGHSYWILPNERFGPGLNMWFLSIWGWALLALGAWVCVQLNLRRGRVPRLRRADLDLLLWLLMEWAGYYAMSPFPATRRLIGVVFVTALIVGRLASRRCRGPAGRARLWLAVVPGIALGLLYAGIDVADSRLEPQAVRRAAEFIRDREPDARIWYTGHWGFQYEAERLGLRPLVPGRSVLRGGDWLVEAPPWMSRQEYRSEDRPPGPEVLIQVDRPFRLRTMPSYYGGGHPIEWWPSPMIEVRVYRIRTTWAPRPE